MTSFRTKRGRCVIDDGSVYLSSSLSGLLKRYCEGGYFGKLLLFFYALLPVYLFYAIWTADIYFVAGMGIGLVILASLYAVNYFRGFRYGSVFPRESVESFTAVEGSKGFTRPRFVMKFRRGDDLRKRYVMMPSKFLSYGEEEFEEAKRKLEQEGFEVREDE
ncbi:MAG: hypothetical protein ABEJ98_00685 [Candidatus Nanohaloarchaea archaeon]